MKDDINLIGIVEDIFQVSGRGVILCLSVKAKEFNLSIGTKIKIVKSDRNVLTTKICGIIWQSQKDILIEEEIKKEDVPLGSEVWLDE